jgi:hypothetical protein
MTNSERFWQRIGLAAFAFMVLTGGLVYLLGGLPQGTGLIGLQTSKYQAVQTSEIPPDDYVGGAACRRCHETIWQRYQTHPMSMSSALVEEASPVEEFGDKASFSTEVSIGEMQYRVEKTSAGTFHHEVLNDSMYGPMYDQSVPISLEIGSGRRGRSYMLTKGDHLYMSPITWYGQESKWDLSPNYPAGKHPRFERRIRQACVVCHTDRVNVSRENPDQFGIPAVPEPKISCERCHGPGARHIQFHDERSAFPDRVAEQVDPIVNPMKLKTEHRESVCWQCHMSGEERVTRHGRLDTDFRPGMHFDDVWVAFVRGTRVDASGAILAVSQVEQTLSSICSQRSEGRFGCLSCHDPHYSPAENEKVSFYRDKCLACHQERGCALPVDQRRQEIADDSCIGCHMPTTSLRGIPHTAQIDHRVLRRQEPEGGSTVSLPLTLFQPGERELPQIEQDRAWGIVNAMIAQMKNDRETARMGKQQLDAVRPSLPNDPLVLEWLGVCEQLLGYQDKARNYWSQILKNQPKNERALKRLADQAVTIPDLAAAKTALIKYLEVSPWEGSYHVQLASICGSLGDFEGARHHAREALHVNPTLARAHGILAELFQQQGNYVESQNHRRRYQRLEMLK